MEQEVVSQVVGLGGSTDFSLVQLFVRADFVVKSVIIILIAASVYSWALIFEKYRLFKNIEKSTSIFEERFWKSKSAVSFYNNLLNKDKDPLTRATKGFESAINWMYQKDNQKHLKLHFYNTRRYDKIRNENTIDVFTEWKELFEKYEKN